MNVDVEIYINQFKTFFEKNPDSLRELIGDINKELFYDKVKEVSYLNTKKGEDISLTRAQIIDVVVSLFKNEDVHEVHNKVDGIFQKSKFGDICLN